MLKLDMPKGRLPDEQATRQTCRQTLQCSCKFNRSSFLQNLINLSLVLRIFEYEEFCAKISFSIIAANNRSFVQI